MTDWEYFRKVIGNTMPKRIPLKSNNDISTAIETFNKCVQSAAWEATPQRTAKFTIPTYPQIAVDLIKKKGKLGRNGILLNTKITKKCLTN